MLNVNTRFITHYSSVSVSLSCARWCRGSPSSDTEATATEDACGRPWSATGIEITFVAPVNILLVLSFSFLSAKMNILVFFSSPFVKEQEPAYVCKCLDDKRIRT